MVATAQELRAAPGLRIDRYAEGLPGARMMTSDSLGTLLVSLTAAGEVVALPDRDGDGRPESVHVVLRGLDRPHGLAVWGGALWVAEPTRVLRAPWDPVRVRAAPLRAVVQGLPGPEFHWTRALLFGADGSLYLAVGSSCDLCRERDPRRAAILRWRPGAGAPERFATGLRNVVGLALEPGTGALWATVNERDWRGGGAPPDYVTAVRAGGDYGWPDCYAEGGRFHPDREWPGGECAGRTLPSVELPPHSAPLGLAFWTGSGAPPEHRGRLVVALHGSRPGLEPRGYLVVALRIGPGGPRAVEALVAGWRQGERIIGRPVDVHVGPGGALYISDDHAGRVYRLTTR